MTMETKGKKFWMQILGCDSVLDHLTSLDVFQYNKENLLSFCTAGTFYHSFIIDRNYPLLKRCILM